MKCFEHEYKIATHLVVALVNGDLSGLEDHEVVLLDKIDQFLVDNHKWYTLEVVGESEFGPMDFTNLHGDYYNVIVYEWVD